eukprot:4990505-Pyramimonas_sp.AAC.1
MGNPIQRVFIRSKGALWRQWDLFKIVLVGTHCILAVRVDHQHRLHHVALGHGTGATAHADWAVSPARA